MPGQSGKVHKVSLAMGLRAVREVMLGRIVMNKKLRTTGVTG